MFGRLSKGGRVYKKGVIMLSSQAKSFEMSSSLLTIDNVNSCIKNMEYAVRGPLVIRALEIEKELQDGVSKPFTKVIRANIGDAHAMGSQPITFLRQVLALVSYPALLQSSEFPSDAKNRARDILECCKGGSVGSYSDSVGLEIIRKHVAEFIEKRDGFPSDMNNIILSAGASESIRAILKLFMDPTGDSRPGIMVPIPQYPLYSASIAEYNMTQIGYYLNESQNWSLDVNELERSYTEAQVSCTPRAIVIINPGNPTGQVLTKENIINVIRFAHKHKLFIFADEVYQDNVYDTHCSFTSFKRVLCEMGSPYSEMEMASFMSTSKGYMGECGIRGGYAEILNLDPAVKALLFKSISAKLCPTVLGQAAMDVVVKPPGDDEPSEDTFLKEKKNVLASLAEKAKLVEETFNSMEGISCNSVQGAMYAFPKLTFPPQIVEKAAKLNQLPDVFFAFQLLENTGICIIPGSGFGQVPGTYHFRTTILPQKESLISMLEKFKTYHNQFLKEYS